MVSSVLLLFALQPDPAALRRLFEEDLARQEKQHGPRDVRTGQAARDLGLFLKEQGDRAGALDGLLRALRIDEEALGGSAPQTLSDAAEVAALSLPAAAEPLWRRASESADPAVASRALAALAEARAAASDPSGAIALYSKALEKEELATGKDSARVAVRLNELAVLLSPADGIPMLRRAELINRKLLGTRHPETATTQANLAGLLLGAGQTERAFATAAAALSIFEETLGPEHPRTAAAATVLAYCWQAKGGRSQAEGLFRRALAIDEKAYGPTHPETQSDLRNLATFLRETGRTQEANKLEQRLR